jgi:hypothetical protein
MPNANLLWIWIEISTSTSNPDKEQSGNNSSIEMTIRDPQPRLQTF